MRSDMVSGTTGVAGGVRPAANPPERPATAPASGAGTRVGLEPEARFGA